MMRLIRFTLCTGQSVRQRGVVVSLFIDPDLRSVRESKQLGADAVELHTGDYANQTHAAGRQRQFRRLCEAAQAAQGLGLVTHAGHGLDYNNVVRLKNIPGIEELNIGYAIVCRALWVGLDAAVKEMIRLIR
jgi:pyridoxine 5-phosphate synthase